MKRKACKFLMLAMVLVMLAQGIILPNYAESAEFLTQNGVMPIDAATDLLPEGALTLDSKSAVLMEATTGTVLYSKNAAEGLPPASVTKIMTLLLIMEAIDTGMLSLDQTVTASANAASMGGSQVFLKEGEQMVLEDLLKSVVIASANDAAVALAEHLCGSVDAFVGRMNQRAEQLGMKNTHFQNVTGLDDTATDHLTSAHDIALMSQELIKHEKILQYSSIWMDTIRDGAFGLTNTNRLVRFYKGCTGLKTGSTSKAGFCVSVTAKRDGLSLICVIMGAESRDERNAEATSLLDWGFANFGMYHAPCTELQPIPVRGGKSATCRVETTPFSCVLPKGEISSVTQSVELPDTLTAPVAKGDAVGKTVYKCGDRVIGEGQILAAEELERINFFDILKRMTAGYLLI